MTSEFDELEKSVIADMKETYSEKTIDHAMNPRSLGDMPDADGFGKVTGPCGDTMEIGLKVKGSVVTDINFLTDGCGTSIASGSMATELARGKSLPEVLRISQQDILKALDGLPEESAHCALLAANTLKAAVEDYVTLRKEPWRKAYRNH